MKIYVGHDSREDIAYQVCEHSIKRRDPSAEVIPLKQKQMRDQGAKHQIEEVGAKLRSMMPWIASNKLVKDI